MMEIKLIRKIPPRWTFSIISLLKAPLTLPVCPTYTWHPDPPVFPDFGTWCHHKLYLAVLLVLNNNFSVVFTWGTVTTLDCTPLLDCEVHGSSWWGGIHGPSHLPGPHPPQTPWTFRVYCIQRWIGKKRRNVVWMKQERVQYALSLTTY